CGNKHYGDAFSPQWHLYCVRCEELLDCEEVLDAKSCAQARSAYIKRVAVVSFEDISPGEPFVFLLENEAESVPHYVDNCGRAYHPSEQYATGRCYTTLQYQGIRRVRRLLQSSMQPD